VDTPARILVERTDHHEDDVRAFLAGIKKIKEGQE
jgi:hypothetical protein